MKQHVNVHFWAEGDDPQLPILHNELSTTLEHGSSRPLVKGDIMSNGEPAATNFTSISVSERLVDDRGNPKTNEVIQDWLRLHHARVRALQCDAMGIQVSIFLMPHDAYEGLSFTPETARAAADAGCGLRVLTYRVLEKKEDSQQGN